jgi:hypothetical protein
VIKMAARMATYDLLRERQCSRTALRRGRQAHAQRVRATREGEQQAFLVRLVWCDRCLTQVPGSMLKRGKITSRLTCMDRAVCDQRKLGK